MLFRVVLATIPTGYFWELRSITGEIESATLDLVAVKSRTTFELIAQRDSNFRRLNRFGLCA